MSGRLGELGVERRGIGEGRRVQRGRGGVVG